MSQREELKQSIIKFCNKRGSRTFRLTDLYVAHRNHPLITTVAKDPHANVRRLLQELEKEEHISFSEIQPGHYTLIREVMEYEEQDLTNILINEKETPDTKEYIRETYIRNTALVQEAKEKFKNRCLIPHCKNIFTTPQKHPYIEVHHIIPLFEGGDDRLWNLATVCAHHHKIAHFALKECRTNMRDILLDANRKIIRN